MKTLAVLVLAACLAALAVTSSASARRLAPSDRKAINETLDILVNHGVKRKNVGAAYDVVTPELRGGLSRAAWSRGAIPIYPYPARGRTFHDWTIRYYNAEEIGIELLLNPQPGSELGQFVFHVYLKPSRGRWLVDSFMPAATFTPIGERPWVQAQADFMASSGDATRPVGAGRIGAVFAWVPFAVIGLILLGLAVWGIWAKLRFYRLVGRRREGLPPSPTQLSARR
jgi:hypothetical protein